MISSETDENRDLSSGDTAQAGKMIRLPVSKTLFQNRADRMRQLAEKHTSLRGFLSLTADLAEMQQHLLENGCRSPIASQANWKDSKYPLDVSLLPRQADWLAGLRYIIRGLKPVESSTAEILGRMEATADDELENRAGRFLALEPEHVDPAVSPFLAAALQVQWSSMAAQLDSSKFDLAEPGYLCPVCGFLPVASVLQTGGAAQGLRYLRCSLCSTEWNRVRIRCVNCGTTRDIAYYGLEGAAGAIKAEACSECKTYIKVMDREKDAGIDLFADDLATLALDILMDEKGFARLGLNPFLIPGS